MVTINGQGREMMRKTSLVTDLLVVVKELERLVQDEFVLNREGHIPLRLTQCATRFPISCPLPLHLQAF